MFHKKIHYAGKVILSQRTRDSVRHRRCLLTVRLSNVDDRFVSLSMMLHIFRPSSPWRSRLASKRYHRHLYSIIGMIKPGVNACWASRGQMSCIINNETTFDRALIQQAYDHLINDSTFLEPLDASPLSRATPLFPTAIN